MNNLKELFKTWNEINPLISIVLQSPRQKNSQYHKVTIRPVVIKDEKIYQITFFDQKQTYHRNLPFEECQNTFLNLLETTFKQAIISTEKNDFHLLMNRT